MLRVIAAIRKHASLRAPILLVGESGVGKDVAARAIHSLSGRVGDYNPINVATIPESLADSELFGHLRGAFTGAIANRSGAFSSAHKGTILLDEIGELPLPIQAKLLRIVEDGIVRPVGATRSQTVDVRIISATWVPLIERVHQGRFRFDLLQRLSTVVIEIPPLRKRRSDIPALVSHWVHLQEPELGRKIFTSAAIARLVAYDWPGNVRELAAVLYRACVGAEGIEVDWHNIDEGLEAGVSSPTQHRADPQALLCRCEGNVSMAARVAGLPRSTFRSRLARLGG
jgi:DNA-binding NtrC family response regulator